MTKTRDLADLGGGFTQAGTGAVQRTVESKLQDVVSVKDFGARGDGLGTTPADEGIDISNESWNTWDGTPFKDDLSWSPYGTSGSFVPPTSKPFQNTDTWDFIGVQLALWHGAKRVYIPEGTYVINVSRTAGGLLFMKGQEQSVIGSGAYRTFITTKEDVNFFSTTNVGSENRYYLLQLYRAGGPPTHISDIAFSGPTNYPVGGGNLTLIYCQNINGVTFSDLWLSSANRGIYAATNSGDSHIKSVTAEYLFGSTIYTDASSDFSLDFCNFWASAAVNTQKGIVALGRCSVTNSRLVGFYGSCVEIDNGLFSNNYCTHFNLNQAKFSKDVVISNNIFTGTTADSLVSVGTDCTITGNYFYQSDNHPCLNLGDGTASSATNITVTGNKFEKTSNAVEAQNYALVGLQSGAGYFGALTASCLLVGNSFVGRANLTPGAATMVKNSFDGVLQSQINAETITNNSTVTNNGSVTNNSTVTNNGSVTNNSTVTNLSDVLGKEIMTGTAASGSTVNITGLLGQGSGGVRDYSRLNLVSVVANGASFTGRIYGLFTSKYNGNATLIATLGTQSDGGSLSFSVSGTDPQFTVTVGAGGNASYTVNAIPLI